MVDVPVILAWPAVVDTVPVKVVLFPTLAVVWGTTMTEACWSEFRAPFP